MNGMLATYEGTLIESYGEGRQSTEQMRQSRSQALNRSASNVTDDHYVIFDSVDNADVRTELESLPSRM